MSAAAFSVRRTLGTINLFLSDVRVTTGANCGSRPCIRRGSEETERLGGIADQEILGLLIVIEHHQVRLATDAGGLVPAERRMRGIGVEAIGPDAAGLDRSAHAIRRITVARPDASAEAVERVICNRERIRLVLELRDRNDRPEDL